MAAELVELADAVVSDLNTQLSGWGSSAVARREYAPSFIKEELGTEDVTVLMNETSHQFATRGGTLEVRPVLLIDVRRATNGSKANNDAVLLLVERIAERYFGRVFDSYASGVATTKAQCVEIASSPAFGTEDLNKLEIFASVVSLTFKVVRAPK